jgi:thiol-disulfide isomerase/thioredoxin
MAFIENSTRTLKKQWEYEIVCESQATKQDYDMKTFITIPLRVARRSLFPVLSVLFALTGLAGEFPDDWTWDDKPGSREEHATLEGQPMPGLELTNWINGTVSAADMKGKVVVVDFYATWCGPCMASIPHNNELLKKYQALGLVIVGVCTSKRGQEKMEETVKTRGIEYPTAQDALLNSQAAWHVHYYPTYAIVDRKGVVRIIGLQPPHVEEVVKKLLDEPAPKA